MCGACCKSHVFSVSTYSVYACSLVRFEPLKHWGSKYKKCCSWGAVLEMLWSIPSKSPQLQHLYREGGWGVCCICFLVSHKRIIMQTLGLRQSTGWSGPDREHDLQTSRNASAMRKWKMATPFSRMSYCIMRFRFSFVTFSHKSESVFYCNY